MKKLYIFFCFALLSSSYLFSYQWPSNKDYLLSLFGSISNNDIQDGIKFSSENQAIYPLADGEIIFYQESFEFGDLDYYGDEGNILALRHVGEFKSIYRNFSTDDNFISREDLSKTEMIGVSTGANDDFLFSLYDDKKGSYINPQQILPFLEDNRKPVINGVYIRNNSRDVKLSRNKRLTSGETTIFIDAWDIIKVRNRYRKFIPFSVNVFVDGFERFNISLSSIKEIDNRLYLSGDSDILVSNLVRGRGMLYGGEVFFTTGRTLIEVVVKDIYGNETSKSYSVIIE